MARICADVLEHGADIVAAQAFGRVREDLVMEAVDFLWIRSAPARHGAVVPIRAEDVIHMGETLNALVVGNAGFQGTLRLVRAVRGGSGPTIVDFDRNAGG